MRAARCPLFPPARRACAALALLAWVGPAGCRTPAGAGAGAAVPETGPAARVLAEPATREERDARLFVQRRLVDARIFREQGRLEAAERALDRALAVAPDDAAAHRLLARILEDQGRRGEAAVHWKRADELDPPPPPPPDTPLATSSEGLAVLLLERSPREDETARRGRRPEPDVAEALLRRRLQVRLPGVPVRDADPASVDAARALLADLGARAAISLRVERGFCDYSRKDGEFAVAWLRVAGARPGRVVVPGRVVKEVLSDPPSGDACLPYVLARGLERALVDSGALDAAGGGHRAGEWSSPALRALFPGLGRRVTLAIERGRARLAVGRVADAVEAFREALAVDPEDRDARAYLREAEDTLAIARALDPEAGGSGAGGEPLLEYRLTPAERAMAESLLDEERRRRDALLAALVIAEVDERPPPPEAVAALRRAPLPAPPAPGPRLARGLSEEPVEARVLYAEDGEVLATYYFARGSDEPLLREEDANADGRPDRWISYAGGVRRDLWEDRSGDGAPDVHVRFSPDGTAVQRIAVDDDADDRPERVFTYSDGRLASEARDTNGDGVLDRFETFDEAGEVVLREEDLDADGKPDIRTRFRDGRLLSREIENPEVVRDLLERTAP